MICVGQRMYLTAGFCLAFFILGCGLPEYRLEGKVEAQTDQVILLDRLARVVLDSIRKDYAEKVSKIDARKIAALDSLANSTSALNRPIANAKKRYNDARAKYRQVFGRLQRFQSFGGNPIFSAEDAGINTQKLLAEVADRFYKGRAFSLETEGQIRRYIRQNLVPLERDMNQKRSRLNQLQRSQSGKTKGRDKLEREYAALKIGLRDSTNQTILKTLTAHRLAHAKVDSSQKYQFPKLQPGDYHLYIPDPLPKGHLVPVQLTGHGYQDLKPDNLAEILLVTDWD